MKILENLDILRENSNNTPLQIRHLFLNQVNERETS